jgi:hypothetical protein
MSGPFPLAPGAIFTLWRPAGLITIAEGLTSRSVTQRFTPGSWDSRIGAVTVFYRKGEPIGTGRLVSAVVAGDGGGVSLTYEVVSVGTRPAGPDAGGDPAPGVWHAVTGTPATPELASPVFGGDFREIDPLLLDDVATHPLLATCACGDEIMRQAPDQPWVHSDPRI